MRKLIRKVLGNYRVIQVKGLKDKYFPSAEVRNKALSALEEDTKRAIFYKSFVKQGDLCYDIGANIGNRIGPLLNLGAKVLAVEPQKVCYDFLKYKFGKKIILVTKGLGESEGEKDFYVSSSDVLSSFSNEWINSVKKSGRFQGSEWNEVIKIEMTTLDKLIELHGLPSFIKIDVEGYELSVLKGLTKPVKMISFEYTVPEQIDRINECLDQIEKYNPDIECNYSIGETMVFALEDWQSIKDIKKLIASKKFIDTGFGDIYVRTNNKIS